MFSDENILKLEDTSKRLQSIFNICKNSGGIYTALNDYETAQPAIIMHLMVCKENFEKIMFSGDNVAEILSKDDLRGLKAIRNIAAHDYDGLNFAIIEETIRNYLPPLKERIDGFLNLNPSHNKIDFTSKFNEFIDNKNNQDKEEKFIRRHR